MRISVEQQDIDAGVHGTGPAYWNPEYREMRDPVSLAITRQYKPCYLQHNSFWYPDTGHHADIPTWLLKIIVGWMLTGTMEPFTIDIPADREDETSCGPDTDP